MRFDWTDLQLFVHACEAGSLTAAAERSHLTLAAASARLRGMEEQAGTALLQRHSRGVRPTAAGEALARHARAVLGQIAQLRSELVRHRGGGHTRLRVLGNTSALARHLPGPLAAFLRAHPQVEVQVEESASHATVQALRQGAADLGVVSDAVATTGLHAQPFREDALVLALPRGHALAKLRRVRFAQALDHALVGTGPSSALHAHLSLQAAHLGKPMLLRAQLAGVEGVCTLVEQGVGAAVLPLALLESRGSSGKGGQGGRAGVLTRPLSDAWARRTLLLCTASAPAAGSPLQQLVEALQ